MPRAWRESEGVLVLKRPNNAEESLEQAVLEPIPGRVGARDFHRESARFDSATLEALWAARRDQAALWNPRVVTYSASAQRADPNVHQIVDVVVRTGYAQVQDFVEDPKGGDLRILFVGGSVLAAEGRECVLRRLPRGGDFRGNVHAGSQLEPTPLSPGERQLVESVGRILSEDGIFLAAADCLGGKLLEVNVFSPGGWNNAQKIYHVDFNDVVLNSIETEIEIFQHERYKGLN